MLDSEKRWEEPSFAASKDQQGDPSRTIDCSLIATPSTTELWSLMRRPVRTGNVTQPLISCNAIAFCLPKRSVSSAIEGLLGSTGSQRKRTSANAFEITHSSSDRSDRWRWSYRSRILAPHRQPCSLLSRWRTMYFLNPTSILVWIKTILFFDILLNRL